MPKLSPPSDGAMRPFRRSRQAPRVQRRLDLPPLHRRLVCQQAVVLAQVVPCGVRLDTAVAVARPPAAGDLLDQVAIDGDLSLASRILENQSYTI